MSNNINIERKENQLLNCVASIVANEVNNKNIILPTIVDVQLSNDLGQAKIYVALGSKKKLGLEALNNAKGFIKSRLAKILDWRKVPNLIFCSDEAGEQGTRIDAILASIKNEK